MTFEELYLYNDNWSNDTVLTLVNCYNGNILACGEGSYLAIFTEYFNSKVRGFKDNTVYLDTDETCKISRKLYEILKKDIYVVRCAYRYILDKDNNVKRSPLFGDEWETISIPPSWK